MGESTRELGVLFFCAGVAGGELVAKFVDL